MHMAIILNVQNQLKFRRLSRSVQTSDFQCASIFIRWEESWGAWQELIERRIERVRFQNC